MTAARNESDASQATPQYTRISRTCNDEEPRTPADGETSDSFLNRMCSYFRGSSISPDTIKEETERMASFAVYFSISNDSSSSKTEDCLARCILRMQAKHSMVFGGMMRRLSINRNIDFYRGFVDVSEELFVDGISWSKVVALYAFAARLAQFCSENHMEDLLTQLTDSLTRFSLEYLLSFLQSQGGWETLCEAFPADNEVEAQVWKGLGILAFGLATCSVVLAIRRSTLLT
eukprot:TRINITY_DN34611_c0_g2_i14.p1 TRINITY_DN34611_c0_g2~~TRINITY_DN34611_c0_g2_i14.p1  ORF type:complete len:232 (+),score=59.13 TRINITY_DN34611_c0_g2_i14:43-738(+)